jgi:hypothetical protein
MTQLTLLSPVLSDLAALRTALAARGYRATLAARAARPHLTLTHPGVPEPQLIYAEGEFFTWHNSTSHVPFSLRCVPPAWTAQAAHLVLECIILTEENGGGQGVS